VFLRENLWLISWSLAAATSYTIPTLGPIMPLTSDTKKVMFEIYREASYGGRYRVVYFTELGEHDKETEIAEAMRGERVFDGFLLHRERNQAKQVVDEILDQLNSGEPVDESAIEQKLQPYLA
jgi:hypothetical protein